MNRRRAVFFVIAVISSLVVLGAPIKLAIKGYTKYNRQHEATCGVLNALTPDKVSRHPEWNCKP